MTGKWFVLIIGFQSGEKIKGPFDNYTKAKQLAATLVLEEALNVYLLECKVSIKRTFETDEPTVMPKLIG